MDRQTHSLSPSLPPSNLSSLPPFLLPSSSRFLWYESLVFCFFFSDHVSNAAWLAWNSSRGWSCLQTHRRVICFCLPIFSFKAWLVLPKWWSPVPSTFPRMTPLGSPLWLNTRLLCVYTSSVCIRLLMSTLADFITQLLWPAPQCIRVCKYFLHGQFRFLHYISRSDTACILNYYSWFFDWSSENICHSVFQYVISVSPLWRKQ